MKTLFLLVILWYATIALGQGSSSNSHLYTSKITHDPVKEVMRVEAITANVLEVRRELTLHKGKRYQITVEIMDMSIPNIVLVAIPGAFPMRTMKVGTNTFTFTAKRDADEVRFSVHGACTVGDYIEIDRFTLKELQDTHLVYEAEVKSAQDYYPYGMVQPGRSLNTNTSRYGFNGQEKDDELKGTGNSYDFGARIYDPRLGRWFSRDKKSAKYPHLSPYEAFENSPIYLIDPDGEDAAVSIVDKTVTISTKIFIYGSGASSQTATLMQNDIMGAWGTDANGNPWKYADPKTGEVYTVKFNVIVEVYDPTDPKDVPLLIPGTLDPLNTDNYIEVDNNSPRSYVKGGDEGVWRGKGRNGKPLAQDDSAPHEFGHLIGLTDRYNKGATVKKIWKGNIMTEAAGKGVVEQRNINAIAGPLVEDFNTSLTKRLNEFFGINLKFTTKIDESRPSRENPSSGSDVTSSSSDKMKTSTKTSGDASDAVNPPNSAKPGSSFTVGQQIK